MKKNQTFYYAMYTVRGDKLVNKYVVEPAMKNGWNWKKTYEALCDLSKKFPKTCGETMDTAVREQVYDILRFADKNENFYL